MLFLSSIVLFLLQSTVSADLALLPSTVPLSEAPESTRIDFLLNVAVAQGLLGQRTLLEILWSCFVTIFACTWVVVHPNIPDESDSEWTIVGRRLKIMIYTLLVPELVLYWASKQWYAAREVAIKHSANGWTKTHGYFIGMGGFVLYKDGRAVRPLDVTDLQDLVELGELDSWPNVSEQDIMDKSKGDYFTKSVVVLQTTWFILQCIARGVFGLALTELELITLAFAALSGAMYFFWWHKPLDVRRPIPLYSTLSATMQFAAGSSEESILPLVDTRSYSGKELTSLPPRAMKATYQSPYPREHRYSARSSRSHSSLNTSFISGLDLSEKAGPDGLGEVSPVSSMPSSPPSMRHTYTVSNDLNDNSFLKWKLNINPVVNILSRSTKDPPSRNGASVQATLRAIIWPVLPFIRDIQELRHSGEILSGNGECRVSTFYAAMRLHLQHELTILFLVTATLFGSLHCAAWSFVFPSTAERWLWRSSALAVSVLPSLFGLQWFLVYKFTSRRYNPSTSRLIDQIERIFHATSIPRVLIMLALYILARIALLVLPILSLRALPPNAYLDISWTNIIPHV